MAPARGCRADTCGWFPVQGLVGMGIRAVWAGLRGPHLGASLFLPSPQQRAQVSQQELRYLWVWVSLSATEAVQKVLLEHHPSWKYLQEVHTLLVNVQQGLRVSWAEVWEGSVCTCMHECVGGTDQGLAHLERSGMS